MLILDRPQDANLKERDVAQNVCVRMRPNGPVVDLPLGKTTIGSSPRCNVRIQQPGVQPLHCLILHGSQGLSVRRWSGDTALNGERIEESPIGPGDCLQIGPVELEIVRPQSATPSVAPAVAASAAPATPDASSSSRLRMGRDMARLRGRRMLAALRQHRDSDRELRKRVSDLERQLERAAADQNSVSGQLQNVMSELAVARRQAEEQHSLTAGKHELVSENAKLGGEVSALTQRVDQLTSEQASAFAVHRALFEEKDALGAEHRRLADENSQLRQQLEQHANQCSQLGSERDEARGHNESLRAELHSRTEKEAALGGNVGRLEHELMQLRTHATELANQINVVCAERDAAGGQSDTLRSEIHILRERETGFAQNVGRLEHENAQIQSRGTELSHRIATLQGERDDARGQVDLLRAEIQSLNDRSAEFADNVNRLEGENVQLQAHGAELSTQIATLQGERHDACGQVERLRAEVQSLTDRIAGLAENASRSAKENAQLQQHGAELLTQLGVMRGERDELRHQNEQLRLEVRDLAQERTALGDEQTDGHREREELRQQLQAAADADAIRAGERAELAAECERLRQEAGRLTQLEQQVRDAVAERESTSSELYRALLQLAEMQDRDDHNIALAAAHDALKAELEKSIRDVAELQAQIDQLSEERAAAEEALLATDQPAAARDEAQRHLAEENAKLAAAAIELRQQLEEAGRREVEAAARWETAETWRKRLEEAELNASDLAQTVARQQNELAEGQRAEADTAAEIAGRERRIAEYEQLLGESRETIQLLEQRVSATNDADARFEQARDEWRRELNEAARQQSEMSQRIAGLESQLTEARAAAGEAIQRAASAAANQVPAPCGDDASATMESAGESRQGFTESSPDFATPEAESLGAFDWSTSSRDSSGFDAAPIESDIDPFAAAPESSESASVWGQPSEDAAWSVAPNIEQDSRGDADDWQPQAAAVGTPEEKASEWKYQAPLDSHTPMSTSQLPSDPTVESSGFPTNKAESQPSTMQSTSFIERYSHMFADERSAGDSRPATDPVPPHAEERSKRTPYTAEVARSNSVSQPLVGEDDEESVEQYMAKLLLRVRGESPLNSAETPRTQSHERVLPMTAPVGFSSLPLTAPPSVVGADQVSPMGFEASKRKSSMPAPQTNLEALRALANESAHRAISRHALRKHRANALTKVIVSALAGFTSLWLMLNSQHWFSPQFITACVAMVVAAYWAGETFRTLLESLRLAASDETDAEIDDEIKVLSAELRAPLPIDVE